MLEHIIGVDCSTKPSSVGLARAVRERSGWRLEAVCTATGQVPEDIVGDWISDHEGSTLLALDAPLGWPSPLASGLAAHRAGAPLEEEANNLFRRATDRVVRRETGKQSLDVGADRIARTAYWALSFLENLRERVGESIPLAWCPRDLDGVQAIEVYPAATLRAHEIKIRGYKDLKNEEVRCAVVNWLTRYMALGPHGEALLDDLDMLDAAVCIAAGLDFLKGRARAPTDLERAQREGWIWFLDPSPSTSS